MRGEDAFLSLAEFAIALAGFTSVVVVFNRRGDEWAPADRFRVQQALTASLGAGVFALLPSALALCGLGDPAIWRGASGLLLVHFVAMIWFANRSMRRLDDEARSFLGPVVPALLRVNATLVSLMLALNTLGIGFGPGPGPFFLALLFQIGVAIVGFTRTVFVRPG